MKILAKVLGEDLVEILVKCCQRPLHDLVQSLWDALDEVLLKSSKS